MNTYLQTWHDLLHNGISGTEVFINNTGMVEIRVLSINECRKYVDDNKNGIPFPNGITIGDQNGLLTPEITNNA